MALWPYPAKVRKPTVSLVGAEVLHLIVLLLIDCWQSVMLVLHQINRFLLMLMLNYLLDIDADHRKHNLVFLKPESHTLTTHYLEI
jgi:hypothetical protein